MILVTLPLSKAFVIRQSCGGGISALRNERHFGKCITLAHFSCGHLLPLVYTDNLVVQTRTCKLCLTCAEYMKPGR